MHESDAQVNEPRSSATDGDAPVQVHFVGTWTVDEEEVIRTEAADLNELVPRALEWHCACERIPDGYRYSCRLAAGEEVRYAPNVYDLARLMRQLAGSAK